MLWLLYAAIKLQHLRDRHSPTISSSLFQNHFDSTQAVSLAGLGFQFAFGIEGYYDKEDKAVADYVQFKVAYQSSTDEMRVDLALDIDVCSDEDYGKFYEPASQYRDSITRARERATLYCIRNPEVAQLFGNENEDFGRINVLVLPCNFGLEPGEVP